MYVEMNIGYQGQYYFKVVLPPVCHGNNGRVQVGCSSTHSNLSTRWRL